MSGLVYFIEAIGANRVKIGWTGGNPRRRLSEIQHTSPFPLRLLALFSGTRRDEREFHDHFASARIVREWFEVTPSLLRLIAIVRLECE